MPITTYCYIHHAVSPSSYSYEYSFASSSIASPHHFFSHPPPPCQHLLCCRRRRKGSTNCGGGQAEDEDVAETVVVMERVSHRPVGRQQLIRGGHAWLSSNVPTSCCSRLVLVSLLLSCMPALLLPCTLAVSYVDAVLPTCHACNSYADCYDVLCLKRST